MTLQFLNEIWPSFFTFLFCKLLPGQHIHVGSIHQDIDNNNNNDDNNDDYDYDQTINDTKEDVPWRAETRYDQEETGEARPKLLQRG